MPTKRSAGAVTLALVTVTLLGACAGSGEKSAPPLPTSTTSRTTSASTNSPDSAGAATVPPAPADPSASAAAAGVAMLDSEGAATHTHTQLRITVDGEKVNVPAGLGIDDRTKRIAVLHTHDDSGLVHVESPQRGDTFTLAQLLALWGIDPTPAGICTVFGLPYCEILLDGKAVIARDGLDVVLLDQAVIRLELRPALA